MHSSGVELYTPIRSHYRRVDAVRILHELDAVTRERYEARARERSLMSQRTELARKLREFGVEAYLT